MKVGLIGLPGSGKTSLFYALTRGEGSALGGGSSATIGVVPVPDPRYSFAVELFHPKKKSPAAIEVLDGAAQVGSSTAGHGQKFGTDFFIGIRSVDAIVQIVRAYQSTSIADAPNPLKEANAISEELLLADLQVIENRLERIKKQLATRKHSTVVPEVLEQEVLLRLKQTLDDFKPLRLIELTDDDKRIIRNFDFLTLKPVIIVVNISEFDIAAAEDLPLLAPLKEQAAADRTELIVLCASVEQEVASLPEEDQRDYLDALGIAEPARDRLIRAAYRALGVQSFFTVGEDEVRAWTVPVGATALIAAGRIHSDLARGFIRAEVLAFDDLIAAKTWDAAKAAGKLRLEGKEYLVKDGDILNIRFKV